MRIRKFKKEDARKVSNIIRKTLTEVNSKDYPTSVIKKLYHFYSPKELIDISKYRDVYVATEDYKILGTASLENNVIYTVFIDPKCHGKGVGSKLMQQIENLAKKRGHKSVELHSSITAYEFYKRIGYKKIKDVFNKGYKECIIMKKCL